MLKQYRGREINTTGDGVLAAFDGPAPAIRCAGAIRDVLRAERVLQGPGAACTGQ
jgi:class 3 adenylate cyclase